MLQVVEEVGLFSFIILEIFYKTFPLFSFSDVFLSFYDQHSLLKLTILSLILFYFFAESYQLFQVILFKV